MKVLNIDEVKGEKLGENAIRHMLVYSENLMLMYSEAKPGGPPFAHSHPHEQLGFILQGTSELTAGGETVILRAGSSFLLEPNEYHEVRSVGNETVKVLDIFHPYREDYVPSK